VWENKVVERILANMSSLMERSFGSVQDLNRYRKELTRALEQRMNEKMQALAPNDAKPASV